MQICPIELCPDVSRPPPPSFQPLVSNGQEDGSGHLRKRHQRAVMVSSSPLKAVAHVKPLDDRAAPDIDADQAPVPPENQLVSTIPSGIFGGFLKGVNLAPKFFRRKPLFRVTYFSKMLSHLHLS